VALLLASIGTYGVLSYAVSQRQREIGVRMALGAQPAQVRNQFLSIGVRLVAAGIAIGILGAWLAGRAMQAILFNVPAAQLPLMGATVVVMSGVALAACLLPATRAARVDPVVALRGD
jgi:ABC-type antimicrobial peptide transport system permease subunit